MFSPCPFWWWGLDNISRWTFECTLNICFTSLRPFNLGVETFFHLKTILNNLKWVMDVSKGVLLFLVGHHKQKTMNKVSSSPWKPQMLSQWHAYSSTFHWLFIFFIRGPFAKMYGSMQLLLHWWINSICLIEANLITIIQFSIVED